MQAVVPGSNERASWSPPPLRQVASPYRHVQAFTLGDCQVTRGRYGDRRRLTISHPTRYPTWDEVRHVRYRLLPASKTFAMLLPPPDEYVDPPGQAHTFELVELRDDGAVESFPVAALRQPSTAGSE